MRVRARAEEDERRVGGVAVGLVRGRVSVSVRVRVRVRDWVWVRVRLRLRVKVRVPNLVVSSRARSSSLRARYLVLSSSQLRPPRAGYTVCTSAQRSCAISASCRFSVFSGSDSGGP